MSQIDKQTLSEFYKRWLRPCFTTRAAAVYIFLFAASIGIATFIENDFGTSAAQKVVFKTLWFEILLLLFSITLVVNIIEFRMVQNKRWALVMFHASMIVILIGAGVTRYFGYEGMMHIREGEFQDEFLSTESYLQYKYLNEQGNIFEFEEQVLFASLGNNRSKSTYKLGNDNLKLEVVDFVPNPKYQLEETDDGLPTLKIVFGGASGRQEYYIQKGESINVRNVIFNFKDSIDPSAFNILYDNGNLEFMSNRVYQQTVMATQEVDTLMPGTDAHLLRLRSLYSDGVNSFVFGEFNAKGKLSMISESIKVKNESLIAAKIRATVDGAQAETWVYGKKGLQGKTAFMDIGDRKVSVSYGSKIISLPFKIKLYDFIMERYPGTNSAASYASEVQLSDPRSGVQEDHRIYMNHILDYGGYRFFQSSFDKDELGTYLSVNHDFWGTWISYIGYILLTIGLIMVFFSKKTRFYTVTSKLKKMRSNSVLIFLLGLFAFPSIHAQNIVTPSFPSVSLEHANTFSQIVVQDHKGRMKPVHTLSRELLRKVSRKEELFGLTADQIILSMFSDQSAWLTAPMIKLGKHKKLEKLLGVSAERAAYKDFFLPDGSYKLRDDVRRAYGLQPIDRGSFEKEIMKLDERVNIVNMIFGGEFLKILPIPGDANNTWVSSINRNLPEEMNTELAEKFFISYSGGLKEAMETGDYQFVDLVIKELQVFQREQGAAVIPSQTQLKSEVFLNQLNVFSRLSGFYLILGIAFLSVLFFNVFKEHHWLNNLFKGLFWLAVIGFAFHTLGLGLRWYVSERAPWSNGYESMIYIAWTTMLAGLIFTRKSAGGMSATAILAGAILLVAQLSYLDPEITPLVPVLKSYWLTIHVSLIAGSYGFLMLGAIIGVINLILIILSNPENYKRIKSKVTELSYISEITLIGGLAMISIGTYLGGVWANESWGRYWGWDAKETWALVTILVYAFILHMRLIPGLKSLYAFNLSTLFGMASVIMTYFGVNYYLSGLHSYAAGDPVPIPNWVYIAVSILTVISIWAYIKNRKLKF